MQCNRLYGLLLVLISLLQVGCERKHVVVESTEDLGYPSCESDAPSEVHTEAEGVLRAGPLMRNQEVVEWYSLKREGCSRVGRARQEWRLATSDVEVVFDEALRPLWAWKRTQARGREADAVDIRRFELRTKEVTIKQRDPQGRIVHKILRGGRPEAVLAPGRGLLTVWIRQADLAVGEKVRMRVLDLRKQFEVIEDVTLRRDADRFEPSMDRTVRVYTIYGRESVFADETNAVIGDLAGLRPYEMVESGEPPAFPAYGALHPRNSP